MWTRYSASAYGYPGLFFDHLYPRDGTTVLHHGQLNHVNGHKAVSFSYLFRAVSSTFLNDTTSRISSLYCNKLVVFRSSMALPSMLEKMPIRFLRLVSSEPM